MVGPIIAAGARAAAGAAGKIAGRGAAAGARAGAKKEAGDFEKERALRLLHQKKTSSLTSEDKESEERDIGQKVVSVILGFFILLFAIGNDALDILVIGQIPILGDVLDFAMVAAIGLWVFLTGLSRPPGFVLEMFADIIIEIIPVAEFIPAHTILVLIIIVYNLFGKKVIEKAAKTVSI